MSYGLKTALNSPFTQGINRNVIDLVQSGSILGAPFTHASVAQTKSEFLGVVIGVSVGEINLSWRLMKPLVICVSRH